MVGQLYPAGDKRLDAAYTIFYMGINVGGALGPFICGYFGDTGNPADFKWAFLAAAIAMVLGVVVFINLRDKHVRDPQGVLLGMKPEQTGKEVSPVLVYLALLVFSGVCVGLLYIDARVYSYLSYLLLASVLGIAYMIFSDKKLTTVEKKKISVIFVVAFFVVFFWSAFEQAGASLTFFAEESTQRNLGFFTVPASWFSSLNSIFVVVFAPVLAWLWIKLGRREPSAPTKMAIGLMLLAIGYYVIAMGVDNVGSGIKVSMMWLIGMYAFHTWGELCLSPIGLSLVNKLAPLKFASLLMAVWFLANAGANVLSGKLSSLYPDGTKTTNFLGYEMHNLHEFFMLFVFMAGTASIILFFLTKWLQNTMNAKI